MSTEHDGGEAPVWFVFGDLMAGLLGLFVLFFAWVVVFELELAGDLEAARAAHAEAHARWKTAEAAREAQARRLESLEAALATPLAGGKITLEEGRIGIAGAVLFEVYSTTLQPEGRALLEQIAGPLAQWLEREDELVMVGGFTDDLPILGEERRFEDNWELSTERALTVVRALQRHGVPPQRIFAAGFGSHHPAVPNTDEPSRARNRRVEIVPQLGRP